MDFNKYYFLEVFFEDVKNNDGFIANIKKDRFYNKFLPFIKKVR